MLMDVCRKAWAAGTGYGSDLSRPGLAAPIWDAKHAEASQAAQDAELEKLLKDLAAGQLRPPHSKHTTMPCWPY